MSDLQWRNEKRRVNDLIPFEHNPRQMSESQVEQLKKSIGKFNLVEIPAIDTDNKIVAGHQRLAVMKLIGRGDEEIDVRVPNRKLTEDEFKEYNLRSNKNIGEWDMELLANAFETDMLLAVGFTDAQLYANGDAPENDEQLGKNETELKKVVLKIPPAIFPIVSDKLRQICTDYGIDVSGL
jgi:hypothetical protein